MQYQLPSLELLDHGIAVAGEESEAIGQRLNDLFVAFNVDARVTGFVRGATVTRYSIQVGATTPVGKVERLRKDIALRVGTDSVRIISPIEDDLIGIEIPNAQRDTVSLRDVLESIADNPMPTVAAMGQDINGEYVSADVTSWPHILVAGSTGSGKSVFINALIMSLIMRATPDQVKLVLIDPKQVEMTAYEGLPHLARKIVTDPEIAVAVLSAIADEMDGRYRILKAAGVRNIQGYNDSIDAGEFIGAKMTHLVVIIDEMADLMMVAGEDVENAVMRIAQLARAAGIHLVLATQRPSADILKGKIKANAPSRLAFAVASNTDSRVILDTGGAQTLLGKGDSLYLPVGASEPRRIQGVWVSDSEIARVTAFWRDQYQTMREARQRARDSRRASQGARTARHRGRRTRTALAVHLTLTLLTAMVQSVIYALAFVVYLLTEMHRHNKARQVAKKQNQSTRRLPIY
ncbi:MAG TPA: DNA translocase FtsK [Gammaproteobacteria bacterium]|nr:DNA translocase FtsK [Gammaproteobacteria bacterium]